MPYVAAFFLVLLSVLMGTCASSQDVSINQEPRYLTEAATRYGKTAFIDTYENDAGTYILVAHHLKPTPEQPLPMVSFFVYDLETDRVVFAETNIKGDVAWEDNRFLKVEITPGTVPGGEQVQQPVYYIDAVTGTRLNEKK